MTATLATVTLDLAKILSDVVESTATSNGSAGGTTVIDAAIPRLDLNDDHFNGGCLWSLSGTYSGMTAKITDFTVSSGTYTVATFGGAIASGVSYAASLSDYPRDILRRAVNTALQNIHPILALNSATVTVADQESYSLPAGVRNVKRLEIATSLVAPYDFQIWTNWEEKNGKIYFDTGTQPRNSDYVMNLWYSIQPASDLTTDAGAISDYYPTEWLKWEAAAVALNWRDKILRGDDKEVARQLNIARTEAMRCGQKYQASLPKVPWETHEASFLMSDTGLDDFRYNGSTVNLR